MGGTNSTPIGAHLGCDLCAEEGRPIALGFDLEEDKGLLTRGEAYKQLSHSASLFGGILEYVVPSSTPGK